MFPISRPTYLGYRYGVRGMHLMPWESKHQGPINSYSYSLGGRAWRTIPTYRCFYTHTVLGLSFSPSKTQEMPAFWWWRRRRSSLSSSSSSSSQVLGSIGQYWDEWVILGKSLKPPRHRCLRNAEDRNLEVLEGGSTSRSHDVREPLSKWINVDDISGLYDTTVPTVSNMIVILSKIIYYHTIIIPTSNNAIYIIIIKK